MALPSLTRPGEPPGSHGRPGGRPGRAATPLISDRESVLGTASSMLVVTVLVPYFLVGMPRIRLFACRLGPQSRRTRVILIGDEIFTKLGGYVLGTS
jgi:predicted PurR-regulated permease PerM